VLGYTEMLRVSRKAIVVIEPHTGLVARVLGTKWERHGQNVNYVFRWNHTILKQVTRSYLLDSPCHVRVIRLWDHNPSIAALAGQFPKQLSVAVAKAAYGTLGLLPRLGNMMIGVVIKGLSQPFT